MSKFRRNSIIVLIAQLLLIAVFNVVIFLNRPSNEDRQHRVDINRIQLALSEGKDVNPNDYPTVIKIVHYDDNYQTNNDYAVIKVNGELYSIEYKEENTNDTTVIFMNIGLGAMFLLTAGVLIYIDLKVLKPFHTLSNYSTELAKGNLSKPMKEEKNKNFGKFVWGMDMLRETLETNKRNELKLQKDKKTLILSISHDIKTPLSAIKLYSKALREGIYDTKEKRMEALNGIDKNALEIEKHVSDIVAASRDDFLNLTVHMGELYLKDLMNKINIIYKEKFATIHTEFAIEAFDNCLVKGDADRLEEVLQNILENAIKYGDGRYVNIKIDEEENYKLIQITNSGCSLKEEELPHLFDSFYRGSNAEHKDGSGLGLYIAKSLMRMMGGDVFVKINNDEFTAVTVVKKC